ncbi:transcription-repair coupling factor [marine sediment metagenome]|uniref:Transcription-repair coupling factor n=1 Tax=marine sediment metagenome TaxID=412755 RepID=A0A1B6NVG7_9ZZZZ
MGNATIRFLFASPRYCFAKIRNSVSLYQQVEGVFIVPVNTLMQRLAPTDYLAKYLLMLNKGDTLDRDQFRRNLEQAGYLHVSQVMSHSEFSVRGSIIDLFPMGSDQPFRIDLFDDEIDSIRYFDTETQRSGEAVNKIRLLPAREFPTDKEAITLFRQQFLEKFDANNASESVFSQVSKGTMPSGVEYYLPYFSNKPRRCSITFTQKACCYFTAMCKTPASSSGPTSRTLRTVSL